MKWTQPLLLALFCFLISYSSQGADQCQDLLAREGGSVKNPQSVLLDLSSRLEKLTEQLIKSNYIPTHRLRYMKAMVLETTVLNQYYSKLYAHAHPEAPWIREGFEGRQAFLEALNVHVSDVSKFRDLEKWLVSSQEVAVQSKKTADIQAYQLLRDELNLTYYQKLSDLHNQMAGQDAFFFEEPMNWLHWFKDYVTFLSSLPGVSVETEKSFLLTHLNAGFRTLHEQMKGLRTDDLTSALLTEAESRIHDLRRQIRSLNIVLLKNSYLLSLKEVDYEWLELDSSVVEGALNSSQHDSRYIRLEPPIDDKPLMFPRLSFYAIYYFTLELGQIKDQLEQVLFLEDLLPKLRDQYRSSQDPKKRDSLDHTLSMIAKYKKSAHLGSASKNFIETIKGSYLFLYTASWIKEFHLK